MAETFVTEGLAKVLKINNICDSEHLADCGLTSQRITTMQNRKINWPKDFHELNQFFKNGEFDGHIFSIPAVKAAAFETANGESVIAYYNPRCKMEASAWIGNSKFTQDSVCVNFVYDLNGKKGPNTVGKDIGVITALYPADSKVVAPMPVFRNSATSASISQDEAIKACTDAEADSRLPNIDELISLFTNRYLFDINTNTGVWSSTKISSTQGYSMGFYSGRMIKALSTNGNQSRCIYR